jgi:hypothetical protein
MPALIQYANWNVMFYHNRAYMGLGFMQGWLWGAGIRSIDEFRLMNPEGKVPEPT